MDGIRCCIKSSGSGPWVYQRTTLMFYDASLTVAGHCSARRRQGALEFLTLVKTLAGRDAGMRRTHDLHCDLAGNCAAMDDLPCHSARAAAYSSRSAGQPARARQRGHWLLHVLCGHCDALPQATVPARFLVRLSTCTAVPAQPPCRTQVHTGCAPCTSSLAALACRTTGTESVWPWSTWTHPRAGGRSRPPST